VSTGDDGRWNGRLRAYLLMHPRTSALYIIGVAAVLIGIDAARMADALKSQLQGDWSVPAFVGAAIGALIFAFGMGFVVAARAAGVTWPRTVQVIGGLLAAAVISFTHPRNEDAITTWGMFKTVVAADTVFVLVLGYFAIRRWGAPVPDFESEANTAPRHGRRWRRRSAARHPGRPGGR
jgi:hypothetical protein